MQTNLSNTDSELVIDAEQTGTGLSAALQLLFAHRELLWAWTKRELAVRYKQTGLGLAWAILQPLSMMILFSVVFTLILEVDTEGAPYPVFSYTALLPWTFFTSSVSFGTQSLASNLNLVQKIYFPREVLPLAAVAAALVDFLVASTVFVVLMLSFGVVPSWKIIVLPVVLILQIFLTIGIVLVSAAANVFYRDLRFVIPLGLQLLLYATPIIYPVSQVPEQIRSFYLLNPMATFIESYRAVILYNRWPEWMYLVVAGGLSFLIALIGYVWFKRVEVRFADII